ncbi:uncharacterized protein A1O9_10743 [Exophiala aquamarina CBS 119918]|uniref:DUF6590 domain-containing protein n=1 Tax=Exophiala aquamarina CBS 119918 TaxID=1182545 RepID=A0A072PCN1_9EURO|nr:uncharacterized protein A1O9_10743 [Exophiala aquamarina CBS 119918]KEF53295.1 hypothetical protein A1O9_10743 [Exophiala aquamarina CBS 119918]
MASMKPLTEYHKYSDGVVKRKCLSKEDGQSISDGLQNHKPLMSIVALGHVYWHRQGTNEYQRFRSDKDTWPNTKPRSVPEEQRRGSRTNERASRFNVREKSASASERTASPYRHSRVHEQTSSPPRGYEARPQQQERYARDPPSHGPSHAKSRSPSPDRQYASADLVSRPQQPPRRLFDAHAGSSIGRHSVSALGLPEDVLDFITIPLNDFKTCSVFISRNRNFVPSTPLSWLDDAALEAMISRNVPLGSRCIQRRVILNQCKGTPESQWQPWLKLLIENNPRALKPFFETCNRVSATLQNKLESQPASDHHGAGTLPISSVKPPTMSTYPQMAPSATITSTRETVNIPKYPISSSPFTSTEAGLSANSPPKGMVSTWHPIPSPNEEAFYPHGSVNSRPKGTSPIGQTWQSNQAAGEPPQAPGFPGSESEEMLPSEKAFSPSHHSNNVRQPNIPYSSEQISSEHYSRRPLRHSPPGRGEGFPSIPTNSNQPQISSESIFHPPLPSRAPRGSLQPGSHPQSQGGPERRTAPEQEDDLASMASIPSTTIAGRATRISASQFGDPESLDPKYRMQNGKKFFVQGRVFAMMYPEPKGEHRGIDTGPDDSRSVITGRRGEKIFSHIKRFVVIKPRTGHCLCVPINSYRKNGVGKKGLPRDERSAHAIIYDSRRDPPDAIIPGEEDLVKNPIAVNIMSNSDTLEPTSRVHFGKIYTIEWNVKVFGIGHIAKESLDDVRTYWRDELI